jgi:multiple sugar transport system ATP-binding protein
LDAALRGDMRVELAKLHQNLKTTMVYVTHDQIEAMTMADKIVVLNDGVVQQFGAPMELYHHPKTKFVAGFIGHPKMNFLKTTNTVVDGNELKVNIGKETISLPVETGEIKSGDVIELGVRPEDLILSSDNQGLSMNVEVVEHLGATVIIYGSAADNDDFCVALPGNTLIQPGQTINLLIDSSKCHAFNSQGIALHRKQAAEAS